MSMGFMVAMAARKRDSRGRYAEDDNDRRMERNYDNRSEGNYGNYGRMGNDHSTYMDGNYSRMNDTPEMRRRRDSRGRYMEDDSRMEYDGNQGNYSLMDDEPEMRRRRDSRGRYMEGRTSAHYMPWPEPHIPPYLDNPNARGDDRKMNDAPVRMRDRNVVNIRDYQDKRRIGFGENRADDDESRPEMRRNVYGVMMHMGGHQKQEQQHGHAGGKSEKLTREKAEKWVRSMHGDDPKSRGEMWSYEDAKKLAEERGLPTEGQEMVDFYVVLNMVYTDYCKVAKEHGVDTEDYYADLAEAWLYDRDAKPPTEKLMAYHKYVIPHGEE